MLSARTLIIILVILFLGLQYKIWVDKEGIPETVQLHHAITRQAKVNDALEERNKNLADNIMKLQHTRFTVEDLAREELNMIKPTEAYYQFVK